MSVHAMSARAGARSAGLFTARTLVLAWAARMAACSSPDVPAESVWVALNANSVRGLPSRSLLPMGRLHPDGRWDLPWPRPFRISDGFAEQASLVPVDADGFLLPPDDVPGSPVRPGIHWLLPFEVADSSGMRSVAPLRWYRYAVGEAVQGRPTGVHRLSQTDNECGFWVLHSREELDGAAPVGLALSRPALRSLQEDDIPGLDDMLTAAGFPHQPSDADGGYGYEGESTVVFEIAGDSARIVSTASMGGC